MKVGSVIVCVDHGSGRLLQNGKEYTVLAYDDEYKLVTVINKLGNEDQFLTRRFEPQGKYIKICG
jgi:hypothetical protein